MENEGLRPHELAAHLAGAYEVVNDRVESETLCELITHSQKVWRELIKGEFEKDENGWVQIGAEDWSQDYQSPHTDRVDALNVTYHGQAGRRTLLGSVRRLPEKYGYATATVNNRNGRMEWLLPDDPRWNAVVGVVERAVGQCMRQQQGGEQ